MPGQSLHAKHNKALVCLLHHIVSNQLLVVLATQLHFHPIMDYLKYAQCFYMVKHLSHFIMDWAATYGRQWKDFAIILGGDLNSLPTGSVMGMLFNMEYNVPDEPNEPNEVARH